MDTLRWCLSTRVCNMYQSFISVLVSDVFFYKKNSMVFLKFRRIWYSMSLWNILKHSWQTILPLQHLSTEFEIWIILYWFSSFCSFFLNFCLSMKFHHCTLWWSSTQVWCQILIKCRKLLYNLDYYFTKGTLSLSVFCFFFTNYLNKILPVFLFIWIKY